MARYTKTICVKNVADVPTYVQPGQWVKVGRERKSRRLVSSTNFGVVAVKSIKGRPVSTHAFRLARGRGKVEVLGLNR